MFDKIVLDRRPQTNYHNTTITENKAPTDESLKLLKEMQQKAFESIFLQYKIETNVVNGIVSYLARDFSFHAGITILWQFDLNGEKYEIKEDYNEMDARMKGVQFAMKGLFEKIANKIAEQMMDNVSENQAIVRELIKK